MSTLELVFTRRFCMGHRLISGVSESCAMPHGHNEIVKVFLEATAPARLDGQRNILLPFAEAKRRWHQFIDTRMDHGFQLCDSDPLLRWFQIHEAERARRIIVTPGDPTTELLAALLFAKITAFLMLDGAVLRCTSLHLEETPTNAVVLRGSPEDYLPPMPRPQTHYWWNRPDDSISDL